jgi:heme exporter protein A
MGAGGPFLEGPKLRVEGLAITRGGRRLFEGLSLEAGAGDFIELRGANGSGKTSLLRAMAGFLRPSAGRIVFEQTTEPALSLHYVGHLNGLKAAASVRAHVRYWAELLSAGEPGADVLGRVGLASYGDLPVRVLSQGQARRLALARLLLARRPIWLLDEPAAALDADGREMLNGLIGAHRARGGFVIAAVHEPLGPSPSRTVTLACT